MRQLLYVIILLLIAGACYAQDNTAAISLALKAAPEELRDGAWVYQNGNQAQLVVLRKGTNDLYCIADDPKQAGLSVSCYHRGLESFMARGRELKQQGKSFQEIFDIREKEVKEGKLKMPSQASTLYVFTSKDGEYNPATGEVQKGYLRYVVYIPFATAESTGLPLAPSAPGMPWIMDPGTHRAHIMINPAP